MTFPLALTRPADPDQPTPCQTNPDAWFSDRPAHVARAIDACQQCPLIDACQKAAAKVLAEVGPSQMWGVWAATHYLPPSQRNNRHGRRR